MAWISRPRMPPDPVLEEARVQELNRASRSVDDYDQLRDEPSSTGHGAWLVVLLAILGIAGVFVLLYLLRGVL